MIKLIACIINTTSILLIITSPAFSLSLYEGCLNIYPTEPKLNAEKALRHSLHSGENILYAPNISCKVYITPSSSVFGIKVFKNKNIGSAKEKKSSKTMKEYFELMVRNRSDLWGAPTQSIFDVNTFTGHATWGAISGYTRLMNLFLIRSNIISTDQTYDRYPADRNSADSSEFFGKGSYQNNGKPSQWQ